MSTGICAVPGNEGNGTKSAGDCTGKNDTKERAMKTGKGDFNNGKTEI